MSSHDAFNRPISPADLEILDQKYKMTHGYGINVPPLLAIRDAYPAFAAELRALRAEKVAGPDKVLRCAFCGQEYPTGTPTHKHEALAAHIRVCTEHPIGKEVRALRAEVKNLRDLNDPPIARIQFPSGCVPGNAKESAEGWKWYYDTTRIALTKAEARANLLAAEVGAWRTALELAPYEKRGDNQLQEEFDNARRLLPQLRKAVDDAGAMGGG